MSKQFEIGESVEWNWGNGTAEGRIIERFTDQVTMSIKGSEVTRHADDDEPAFLIEQHDGDEVLKSITEIRSA
jgi:hypothetical protein